MKTLLIVGSHNRNLSLLEALLKNKKVKIEGVIIFKRENIFPKPKIKLSKDLTKLWNFHFKKRDEIEKKYFGFSDRVLKKIKNKIQVNSTKELHSNKIKKFIKKKSYDCCFLSGAPILKEKLLNILPENTINLHLGLIPYYKGTITIFWPFYFLEPNMAGTTYHIIDKFVDTGEIIHQNVPLLKRGDSMHEVSCKAIKSALEDLDKVINFIKYRLKKKLKPKKDATLKYKGKLFLNSDWKPEMLKVIYGYYRDKIVDIYLDNQTKNKMPKLIKIKNRT